MKPLLSLVMMLAAAGAQAQINHPYNEIGIYTVEQPDGCATAQIDVAPMVQFTCYLVLTKPYSETLGRPVATVGGVECRYVLPDGLMLLSGRYPPGTFPPCFPGPGELLFACNVPVVDDRCVLFTFTFMSLDGAPGFIHLTPLPSYQSLPGQMAFTDYDDEDFALHAMHPVSGSFDVPVFAINWDGDLSFCETVPVRDVSFGKVKALYR